MDFQPESLIQAMTTGYDEGQFEVYEIRESIDEYSHLLTDEELSDTQRVIHRHFSILTTIHDCVTTERIRRNPPNQMTT